MYVTNPNLLGVDRARDFRDQAGSGFASSGSGLGPIMKLDFGRGQALYFRARVGSGLATIMK